MRGVDVLMALPSLLLAIVVVAILGPSLWNALWAVVLVNLPGFIRIARAAVIAEKEKEYVHASRAFGAGRARQMLLTILPNCLGPMIVQGSLGFSDAILNMAALGFLGLGAQAPTPEWGTMLSDSKAYIESAPWLVTWPGLCILTVVLAFNLWVTASATPSTPKFEMSWSVFCGPEHQYSSFSRGCCWPLDFDRGNLNSRLRRALRITS